jgi:LPS sulfotransferase NodH
MSRQLFDPSSFDQAAYNTYIRETRPAKKRYVIYFTARSSSSWLTDIARKTRRLSTPDEAFNPNFVPNMSKVMNASNIDQYVRVLLRRRNNRGVFGFEITFYQLRVTFGSIEKFMEYFRNASAFWLIREDIVQQAVSLYKMETTQVTHKAHLDAKSLAEAETKFVYDREQIKYWLQHLLNKEIGSERMFAEYDIAPLRLSYEVITAMSAHEVVNVMAKHINQPPIPVGELSTEHGKLGTSRNAEFAERFRHEEAEFMQEVFETRRPWLQKIERNPPTGLLPDGSLPAEQTGPGAP